MKGLQKGSIHSQLEWGRGISTRALPTGGRQGYDKGEADGPRLLSLRTRAWARTPIAMERADYVAPLVSEEIDPVGANTETVSVSSLAVASRPARGLNATERGKPLVANGEPATGVSEPS